MFVSYFDYWNKDLINQTNSENPDETAHKEPSHLDFHCLQMYGPTLTIQKTVDFKNIINTVTILNVWYNVVQLSFWYLLVLYFNFYVKWVLK